MNTTITIQNRIWLPLVAAGSALALAIGLLTFVVLEQQTGGTTGGHPSPIRVAPAELPQADWKVVAKVGGAERVPKRLRARAKARAGEVAGVVRKIFDAVFLDPAEAQARINETFTRKAAAAIREPGFGLPEGAEQVQTKQRKVAVTVYAGTGAQAVARTVVKAKGVAEDEPFALRHTSFLWLVKKAGAWQVVAFELAQEP